MSVAISGLARSRGRILFQKVQTAGFLVVLAAAALLTHGYHPYAEDAEIYLPGVERILNPKLFPVGREYFQSHASMTLFPNLVAGSLRITHLPLEAGLMIWHVASIFLLLVACWQLSGVLFANTRARWGSVCMIAALLTIPVAGTALYILDQYLNPRNLAAFAGVFALTRVLEKKYVRATMWLLFAACVHPLMWVFPFSFCALWLVLQGVALKYGRANLPEEAPVWASAALLWIPLAPQATSAYHEAAKLHAYHYIQNWEWYQWLGIVAPLVLLEYFARAAKREDRPLLARVCRVFVVYGIIYFVAALIVDLPARFESLARLQPMRSLHLLYIFLFLCIGGFLGEFVLRNRWWRWLALFVPLSVGMFAAQRALFPASAHVEWPGQTAKNPWAQAFFWIRQNTPVDAVFAMDPRYMHVEGEDEIGFRCLAQRSRLADAIKDNGVVSMFPGLAEKWWDEVQAQTPWRSFGTADFARLEGKYGVSWVVVQQPGVAGMDCEYQNRAVRVCRLQ